jgi:Flp pilus assembly pilin Flp
LPHTPPELDRRYAAGEDGQTMAEYVVVLGVITLAIVTSFALMSGAIQSLLEAVVRLFS